MLENRKELSNHLVKFCLSHYEFEQSLIHSGEKPFSCKICEKSFKERGSLNRHKLIHAGKKFFSCDICEKSFTQKGDLKKHKFIHDVL